MIRVMALLTLVFFPGLLFALAPLPESRLAARDLAVLWADLASAKEDVAARALLKYATAPDDAVAFMKSRVRPLTLDREQARNLLADLGAGGQGGRFAIETLQFPGPQLVFDVEEQGEILLGKPAKDIIGAIFIDEPWDFLTARDYHWNLPDSVNYQFTLRKDDRHGPWKVTSGVSEIGRTGRKLCWTHVARVVALLEHVGTPEARKILADLATGHPDAGLTRAARQALARRGK